MFCLRRRFSSPVPFQIHHGRKQGLLLFVRTTQLCTDCRSATRQQLFQQRLSACLKSYLILDRWLFLRFFAGGSYFIKVQLNKNKTFVLNVLMMASLGREMGLLKMTTKDTVAFPQQKPHVWNTCATCATEPLKSQRNTKPKCKYGYCMLGNPNTPIPWAIKHHCTRRKYLHTHYLTLFKFLINWLMRSFEFKLFF